MHVRAFSFWGLCARNVLTFAALCPGGGLCPRCQYYRSPSSAGSRPSAPSMGRAFPLFPSFFFSSSSSSSFLALLVLARRGGATRWRQSFRQRTACRMSGEWGPSLCAVASCPLWRAPCKGQKREGNVRLLPAPCAGVFVVIRPAGDRRRQARGMSSPPKTHTSPSSRHRRSRSRTAPGP